MTGGAESARPAAAATAAAAGVMEASSKQQYGRPADGSTSAMYNTCPRGPTVTTNTRPTTHRAGHTRAPTDQCALAWSAPPSQRALVLRH